MASRVTHFKFSFDEQKNYEIEVNGNLTMGESTDIVDKAISLFEQFHDKRENVPEEVGENQPEPEEAPDVRPVPLNLENEEVKEEFPENYKVYGNAMSSGNIPFNEEFIKEAYLEGGSLLIKASQPIWRNGQLLSYYRVVFPDADGQHILLKDHALPENYMGKGYPVCSCPSYVFQNHKKGYCKHIEKCLEAINLSVNDIVWENFPSNLPLKMKHSGLEEYQWVPSNENSDGEDDLPVLHRTD